MFMRVLPVCAVLAAPVTSAAGPGSGNYPRMGRNRGRGAALLRRDAIVRSTYLDNPTWSAPEIFQAVQPLIAAAGLKPMSYRSVATELVALRKELKIPATWGGMNPAHTKFLRDEFARDSSQPVLGVLAKFRTAWGPVAEPDDRVTQFWRNALWYANQKAAYTGALSAPQPRAASPSLTPPDVSADWWTLGEEFDKYLSPDSRIPPR